MITNSILKIYEDKLLRTLLETIEVVGSELQAQTYLLEPGSVYWATVQVTDSEVGTSEVSYPYRFYSLPNIVFYGDPTINQNKFEHQTAITTDVVGIEEFGIVYNTTQDWSVKPVKVVGNVVENLLPHTTYYYRPYVKDEFGRFYVNVDDTRELTTSQAIPVVKITQTYTPTTTTFGGLVEVISSTAVTSVIAEVGGGTTTSLNLVAAVGEQEFEITGLEPYTKYNVTIKATNEAGEGVSNTVFFTTAEESGGVEEEGMVNIISVKVSETNDMKVISFVNNEEGTHIESHIVYLYDNSTHSGEPLYTYDGGKEEVATANFENLNADTTYFAFSSVVIQGKILSVQEWSEGYEVRTYSLITVREINTTNTSATFDYSIEGYSSDTQIEYSQNGETWKRLVLNDPQGGELVIEDLTPNTTYHLRARVANSDKKYSDYYTTTFTTEKGVNISITGFTKSEDDIIVGINITEQI